MMTPLAMPKKIGIAAIAAVLRIGELRAPVAIDAFVARLRIEDEKAIDCLMIAVEVGAVVAVFVIACREDEIAILVVRREVGVVAVLVLETHIKRWQRHHLV
jgi:hypothetical protein